MTDQEFNEILRHYKSIKEEHADKQFTFYSRRVNSKRRFAQWSGALVLVFSLAIPIVVNLHLDVMQHNVTQHQLSMIVTVMSLLIALVTGLEGLHQWRTTWIEYSRAIVHITTLIGLWEVQAANARALANREQVSKALGDATDELLTKVEDATLAEMARFFSARSAIAAKAGAGNAGDLP